MSATYSLGQNQHSEPLLLVHNAETGWKIRNVKSGAEVHLSPDQIALIHQVAKPK